MCNASNSLKSRVIQSALHAERSHSTDAHVAVGSITVWQQMGATELWSSHENKVEEKTVHGGDLAALCARLTDGEAARWLLFAGSCLLLFTVVCCERTVIPTSRRDFFTFQ